MHIMSPSPPATAVDNIHACVHLVFNCMLTISRGPGSVTGRASGGEESMTNKPLVLEITSHKACHFTIPQKHLLLTIKRLITRYQKTLNVVPVVDTG